MAYRAKNPWLIAKDAANSSWKLGRKERYGASYAKLYDRWARIKDNGTGDASLVQQQLANRNMDGYTGQGVYRRRSAAKRRYSGKGAYSLNSIRRQASRISGSAGRSAGALVPLGATYGYGQEVQGAADVLTAGAGKFGGTGLYMPGQVTGAGEYTVGNDLIAGLGTGQPTFASAGDETGALLVTHTEYITDIFGNPDSSLPGSSFINTSFEINPGLSASFPFLSQIASNFEEYSMVQLMFSYKSKMSQNLSSTDGQVGSVLMFTDYNSNDKAKVSKQAMVQGYGTSNGIITGDVLHGVECDNTKLTGTGSKYIRVRPETGEDKNAYDWGTFQVAISGTPTAVADQPIGELSVTYTCILRKPRVFSLYGLTLNQDSFSVVDPDMLGGAGGPMVVTNGPQNSIRTLMTIDPAAPGLLQMTFPANFSGDVKIAIAADNLRGTVVKPTTIQGEVRILPQDIFGASLGHVSTVYSNDGAFTGNWACQSWFHVEMAVGSVDNKITIGFPYDETTAVAPGKVMAVNITRFNGGGDQ
jgi:hypothetical protein